MKRPIILEVKNLKKKYENIMAVNDISFTVKKGSLFAFLGPNGAGKSTTIKIISTLLDKTSGSFLVNNSSDENYIRKTIGAVFQENVLDDLLTVKENLIYRGSLYINNKFEVLERYQNLVMKLSLKDIEHQKFKTLSGGQKRRVEIARALFSNPEILLLDEPTTGLDPNTRKEVWNLIEKLIKEDNITVFLTTHYMEEASNADYVVIIDKGEVKASGTPNELKNIYSKDKLIIVAKNKLELQKSMTVKGIYYKKVSDMYIIEVDNTVSSLSILNEFKDNILSFEVIKGSLDDVFISVVGEENVSI